MSPPTDRPFQGSLVLTDVLFCEGNFWNAASFSSPASHLHFPSVRGETSTDISFYFKTSSTHGVFLENLGATDFLRIELRGEV